MIRTTYVARLALIGVVAAAVAAPGAQAATKVVHADDRADRAAPAGLRLAAGAPVTPDNRAERAGPAGIRLGAPTPVTPDNRADRPSPPVAPVLIVPAAASGFSWTAAGIGAAAMLGFGLSVVGVAVGFRRPNPETLRT
jgi:hypothetical protein